MPESNCAPTTCRLDMHARHDLSLYAEILVIAVGLESFDGHRSCATELALPDITKSARAKLAQKMQVLWYDSHSHRCCGELLGLSRCLCHKLKEGLYLQERDSS